MLGNKGAARIGAANPVAATREDDGVETDPASAIENKSVTWERPEKVSVSLDEGVARE